MRLFLSENGRAVTNVPLPILGPEVIRSVNLTMTYSMLHTRLNLKQNPLNKGYTTGMMFRRIYLLHFSHHRHT